MVKWRIQFCIYGPEKLLSVMIFMINIPHVHSMGVDFLRYEYFGDDTLHTSALGVEVVCVFAPQALETYSCGGSFCPSAGLLGHVKLACTYIFFLILGVPGPSENLEIRS